MSAPLRRRPHRVRRGTHVALARARAHHARRIPDRPAERTAAPRAALRGFRPEALDLAPTTHTWATGPYGALVQTGGSTGLFRLARQEARVGVASAPAPGCGPTPRRLAQAWLGAWNVGGGRARAARLGGGAPAGARSRPSGPRRPRDRDVRRRRSMSATSAPRCRWRRSRDHADRERQRHGRRPLGSRAVVRCRGFGGANRDRASGLVPVRRRRAAAAASRSATRAAAPGRRDREGWLRGRVEYGPGRSSGWASAPARGAAAASATEYTDRRSGDQRRRARRVRPHRRRPRGLAAAARLVADASAGLHPGRAARPAEPGHRRRRQPHRGRSGGARRMAGDRARHGGSPPGRRTGAGKSARAR